MEKLVEQGLLYDFYGEMLDEHKKKIFEDYVLNDLSLAEIADEEGISRQGVRDSIKRGEDYLFEMEVKLGFIRNFRRSEKALENIKTLANEIIDINRKSSSSIGLIEVKAAEIVKELAALDSEN